MAEGGDMLTLQEAAALLGISRTKLYDLMKKRVIVPATARNPLLDRPRRHLFLRADVLRLRDQAEQGRPE